jgi:hypothetical protein
LFVVRIVLAFIKTSGISSHEFHRSSIINWFCSSWCFSMYCELWWIYWVRILQWIQQKVSQNSRNDFRRVSNAFVVRIWTVSNGLCLAENCKQIDRKLTDTSRMSGEIFVSLCMMAKSNDSFRVQCKIQGLFGCPCSWVRSEGLRSDLGLTRVQEQTRGHTEVRVRYDEVWSRRHEVGLLVQILWFWLLTSALTLCQTSSDLVRPALT